MEIGEYFFIQLLVWSTIFFPKTKVPDIFRAVLIWVGSGLGFGLGLGLELVSRAVFWAFFEISLVITLKPHVGHTKFPHFYTFIVDNNPYVRSRRLILLHALLSRLNG